jgi:subtilisin family serine protease
MVVVLAALTLVPVAAPTADGLLGLTASGTLLVGHQPGALDAVTSLMATLGGAVTGAAPEINALRVDVPDLAAARTALSLSPLVTFVESDGRATEAGAQWNGADWNGAQWNGADWNGADWNGAQWNGAQWNNLSGAPTSANDPGRGAQWGLLAGDVPTAWKTTMGTRSVPVCVIDSGIDLQHPDLAANLWTGADGSHGVNFVSPGASANDDAGHGTHVAGIAAAATGNGKGIAGLAKEKIMAVKVLAANGTGTEANLAMGIAWCADHGAKVISMSLGTTIDTKAVKRAVSYAFNHGSALVASVGNTGPCGSAGCVRYPASYPEVMGVTALNTHGQPLPSDATGKLVSIAAPGWGIVSTYAGGQYRAMTGTSMAVPFVSATLAQVMDLNPSLGPAAADNLVAHTAKDLGPRGRDPFVGFGAVNAGAALAAAAAH